MTEIFEIWEIDQLVPHPKNPKKHPKEQIKTLAGLIRKFGWTNPIVVQKSTGYILAGHGRRLAGLDLKLARVPVIVKDVSDEEAMAILLSDNRVVSSDYDTELLQGEMVRLSELGFDMGDLGFTDKEMAFLTADLGALDMNVFVEDISGAVEEQKRENDAKTAAIDDEATAIGQAFGFKKVSVVQARRIKDFIARLESETKKKGADALMTFLDAYGIA